jgi:hypothetical protein
MCHYQYNLDLFLFQFTYQLLPEFINNFICIFLLHNQHEFKKIN